MDEETTAPEFSLPEWGTAGAPVVGNVDRPSMDGTPLSTTGLPDGFVIARVLGVMSASSSATVTPEDPADAQDAASSEAVERLAGVGAEAGADAVIGVRLVTTTRKDWVTVTAYGTGVTVV